VARRTRLTVPMIEDLALPFHVPHDTDPRIWLVKVKVDVLLSGYMVLTNDGQPGREADVVLQICC
jgi:hypothetical protein